MINLGRPKLYNNVEDFSKLVDSYFKKCDEDNRPYTISGLAHALDMDRKSLLNYSKDANFFPTIKKAKEKVEQQLEESLYRLGNNSGVIFNLKNNFGWKDSIEVENNNEISKLDELLKEIKKDANK